MGINFPLLDVQSFLNIKEASHAEDEEHENETWVGCCSGCGIGKRDRPDGMI